MRKNAEFAAEKNIFAQRFFHSAGNLSRESIIKDLHGDALNLTMALPSLLTLALALTMDLTLSMTLVMTLTLLLTLL